MNPLKGACIIGQSGGPTAVINASALGAIQSALQSEQVTRVLGAANGIEGVLKERLFDMAREDPGELELLKYTPASALGSCRYKMAAPSVDDTDYRRLLEIFRKYDVRYFFYNGGNDSMDTCNKISKFMQQSGYECRVIVQETHPRRVAILRIINLLFIVLLEEFRVIRLHSSAPRSKNRQSCHKAPCHSPFLPCVPKTLKKHAPKEKMPGGYSAPLPGTITIYYQDD